MSATLRWCGFLIVLQTIVLMLPHPVWAEPAIWNGSIGNWSDAARWSTSPLVPNNGGTTYDVSLAAGTLTQDVAAGITVESLDWSGGTLAGTAPLTVNQTVNWSNGALKNSGGLIVPIGATLNFTGNSTQHKLDDGGKLSLAGTFNLIGDSELNTGAAVANGATIEVFEAGTFDIQGNGNLTDTFFDNAGQVRKATLTNAGTFKKSSGSETSLVTDDWMIENTATGTLEVNAGTLRFSRDGNGFDNAGLAKVGAATLQVGGGTSSGRFEVAAGGTLRFATRQSSPSIVHVLDGATIENAGTLEIDGRVRFLGGTTITGNPAVSLLSDDTEISGNSPLALDTLIWNGGTLANSAGVTINAGGTATLSGSGVKRLANNARLEIAGTTTLAGTQNLVNLAATATPAAVEILAGGSFDLAADVGLADSPATAGNSAGTLTIDGTLRKSAGSGVSEVSVDWTVENHGAIEVDSGTLRISGPVAHHGLVDVAGGNIEFRGNVSGAGGFTGAGLTTFRRDYRPGPGPAAIDFGGNLKFETSAANLYVELGGTTPGTQFDQLVAAGSAALAGTLRVALVDTGSGLFAPQAGHSFPIITAAGGVTGQFTALLPALADGLAWQAIASETAYTLHVVSTSSLLAGDYNLDGQVDAADYTVWRDSLGLTGSALAADGNLDESIDDLDYMLWKTHFGETSPIGSAGVVTIAIATPEPSSLVLLMTCTLLILPRFNIGRP
jgi:fibronectin-binding autotransporter adhesin